MNLVDLFLFPKIIISFFSTLINLKFRITASISLPLALEVDEVSFSKAESLELDPFSLEISCAELKFPHGPLVSEYGDWASGDIAKDDENLTLGLGDKIVSLELAEHERFL